MAVQSDSLRKFTDLAFDGFVAMRWKEPQEVGVDNVDVGPTTDLQNDLFEAAGNPF
jgi:hypothetical protein